MNGTLPKYASKAWSPKDSVVRVLPVMLIKDPFMWWASSCRHGYFIFRKNKKTCPYPLNLTTGILDTERFQSLVHVWSSYILEYMNATFPLLIVRYEDLLYRTEEVISKVCACIGGVSLVGSEFGVLQTSAKWGSGHAEGNDRTTRLAD